MCDIPRTQWENKEPLKSSDQILVTPGRAERILADLANTPDWPRWIGERSEFDEHIEWVEEMRKRYPTVYRYCSNIGVITLRELLRRAWNPGDARAKEWFLFRFRYVHHAQIMRRVQSPQNVVDDWLRKKALLDSILANPNNAASALHTLMDEEQAILALKEMSPPPMSELEGAAFYLQRNLAYALRCPNPGCKKPYFFSYKKNTKYCSPECRSWGKRESKRSWWRDKRGKGSKRRK